MEIGRERYGKRYVTEYLCPECDRIDDDLDQYDDELFSERYDR
jgi:hypothetical protein